MNLKVILANTVIVAAVIVGLMIFLMSKCNEPKVIPNSINSNSPIQLVYTKHDTIKPDTIKIHEFHDRYHTIVVHDSIKVPYKDIRTEDSLKQLCMYQRAYLDSFIDSNVTIYSHIKTLGELQSLVVNYRLKVPLKITTTEYFSIKPTFELYGGLEAGGSKTRADLSGIIGCRLKSSAFQFSHDVINQETKVAYLRTLFSHSPKINTN